jgi:GH24 family phage-related lysozyme (muramidase)
LSVARPQLDRDPGVSYPQGGGPIGAALTEFGSTITEVAGAFDAEKDRRDIFDANLRAEEFEREETLAQQDAVVNAPADGSDMVAGLYGEVDPKTGAVVKQGSFDKRFNEAAARMPASQRQEFLAKRELYRKRGTVQVNPLQTQRRRDYEDFEVKKKITDLENDIAQADPNDARAIAALKERGAVLIRSQGYMDEQRKNELVVAWNQTAEEALVRAMNTKDPSQVRGLLGMPKPGEGGAVSGGPPGGAAAILRKEEGFRETPYWDVNALRAGYGSDTVTRADGTVEKVTKDTRVSREDAERDLVRRMQEFERTAAGQVATDAWARLPENARAALVSVTYNYGSLPGSVVRAVRSGDLNAIASAVESLPANPDRRKREAAIIRGGEMPAGSGGAGPIDPRFANLTLDQRLRLANAADSAVAEQMAALRADLDVITTNAPVAIQNTGTYTGAPSPSQEDFIKAYGVEKGPQQHRVFQASVETAKSVYAMQKMPEAEIQSMLKAAAPLATGDTAALGAAKYASLEAAAEATMKARAADPAGYVSNAFPNVKQDWQNVSQAAPNQRADAYSRAVAASIAAQEQLGITDVQPLPKNIADNAVKVFKDVNVPEEDRIQAAAIAVSSTPDPKQQAAIFEQLVDAGLPEITQGAFRALSRGDEGAARRLFQASIVDPTKLPGQSPQQPAVIEERIQSLLMSKGQVGDVFYGLRHGVADNFVKAERDTKLMTNAVNMLLRQGVELDSAVMAVGKDLYGDVQIVTSDGRANMQILMPAGENPEPIIEGLEAQTPAVRKAVEASLAAGRIEWEAATGAPTTGSGMKAVGDAATQNHADYVMAEGHWRNAEVEGGFVWIEPYDGEAITDAAGEPIIFKPILVAPGVREQLEFEQRTPEAGAGPSVDESGNPVVLPK